MSTGDLSKSVVEELLEKERDQLVQAMVRTNQPLERGLAQVNEHLKELNGKVAAHALALARGSVKMQTFRRDIDGLERRVQWRRAEDKGKGLEDDQGENRRITMFHVTIFVSGIGAAVAFFGFLKLIGVIK